MEFEDLKEVIIPQVGIRYEATEKNVQVYGSDSIGWEVWVKDGNRFTCINPKNKEKGGIRVFAKATLAIANANRYLTNNITLREKNFLYNHLSH